MMTHSKYLSSISFSVIISSFLIGMDFIFSSLSVCSEEYIKVLYTFIVSLADTAYTDDICMSSANSR